MAFGENFNWAKGWLKKGLRGQRPGRSTNGRQSLHSSAQLVDLACCPTHANAATSDVSKEVATPPEAGTVPSALTWRPRSRSGTGRADGGTLRRSGVPLSGARSDKATDSRDTCEPLMQVTEAAHRHIAAQQEIFLEAD